MDAVRRQLGPEQGVLCGHDERHRHLVQLDVGPGHHGGLGDAGHLGDDALDLAGGDVLAADPEHVLGPARERDPAVGVHRHQVAGAEPAVLVVAVRGGLRLFRYSANIDSPGMPRISSAPVSSGPTGVRPSGPSTARVDSS
jgi:hypothetical protein